MEYVKLRTGSANRRIACFIAVSAMAGLPGCLDSMWNGSKLKPLEPSPFFADGRSSRSLLPDTVARGHLITDSPFDTGGANGKPVENFPVPVTRALVDRGQQRFNIYCAPCHGRTGKGDGMIVQRGFPQPPSYHTNRLRKAPVGHFFDVITNGYGVMYSYSDRVAIPDRWAVAAYIRVLQRSQNGSIEDVPARLRMQLEGDGK